MFGDGVAKRNLGRCLAIASLLLIGSCGEPAAEPTESRWSGVGYLARPADSPPDVPFELCFGLLIGPGPNQVDGCSGLRATGYDAGADAPWELSQQDVMVVKFTGILATDRSSIDLLDVERLPDQYVEIVTTPVSSEITEALKNCRVEKSWDPTSLKDAGLTTMPLGIVLSDDTASYVAAIGVDMAWVALACQQGLSPTSVEDFLAAVAT
jgi:hypothetical protein